MTMMATLNTRPPFLSLTIGAKQYLQRIMALGTIEEVAEAYDTNPSFWMGLLPLREAVASLPEPADSSMRIPIYLDRDGVLCINTHYPYLPSELVLGHQVPPFFRKLWKLTQQNPRAQPYPVVVSNQSGVSRGYFTPEDCLRFEQALSQAIESASGYTIPLDRYYHCWEQNECFLRKPNPGMLLLASLEHKLNPGQGYMVGDKPSDIAAGRRAGVRKAFLLEEGTTLLDVLGSIEQDLVE